jgi:predicted DsbA family dithiol-disulfide isomerase
LTLKELFAGRPVNVDQILDHLKKVADELGLPFGERQKTYNSRMAQELGKLAEHNGCGEKFHTAVFNAYFVEGLNIAEDSNLLELGKSVGLSTVDIRDTLEKRSYKEAVDEDWNRSYQMGITAVPSFVMNGMSLIGAQPYEKLVQLVKTCGAIPRNKARRQM